MTGIYLRQPDAYPLTTGCLHGESAFSYHLGVNLALGVREPSPTTFFIPRAAFASKRDPPGRHRMESVQTASAFDAWCLYR